jgi:two-component system chemotaxis sensor kinase CheA
VHIPASRLDAILLQVEEMLGAKLSAQQRALETAALHEPLESCQRTWGTMQQDIQRFSQLIRLDPARAAAVWENAAARFRELLDQGHEHLKSLQAAIISLAGCIEQDHRALERMLDNLLEDIKHVLMLPFSSLLEAFPKMVRDIARAEGKQVEFEIRGGEVEIDRRILAGIKDPLIHLVRNSVDHGIEPPAERLRAGKPERGRITVAISQIGGDKVEILVADDGRGIDTARVRAKAVASGLVSEDAAAGLTESEIHDLLFRSGFSTSALITEISGRGLGLAIVREKASEYGGSVSVQSRPGEGTTFRLVLPVTLATFRGVVVEVQQRRFVIPTMNVERVLRVQREDVATVENRSSIAYEGRPLALVRLAEVLELPGAEEELPEVFPVLVLSAAGRRLAFVVDQVVNEREVLVKGLGKFLQRVRNVAAATVFGSGEIAPILNAIDLVKSARRAGARPAPAAPQEKRAAAILVAEDSVTSRMLLQGILEGAGYTVKTAVDGAEAFAMLRTEPFDLLVSDVEMPRMDGFQLTAKVREHEELAELPVVLVTSLDSQKDRERGIDVGANAYIVKRDFEQSNLLEIIERLL